MLFIKKMSSNPHNLQLSKLYEKTLMQYYEDKNKIQILSYQFSDSINYFYGILSNGAITKKNENELKDYSDAKAKGYYYMMYDRLYNMNSKLPDYNLPKILENIPETEIKTIFYEIYYSARNIAGKLKEE